MPGCPRLRVDHTRRCQCFGPGIVTSRQKKSERGRDYARRELGLVSQRGIAGQACRVLQRRGPKTKYSDAELTEKIRAVIAESPFHGEGHRKVWARLRFQEVRASKARVLRLMREAQLLGRRARFPGRRMRTRERS